MDDGVVMIEAAGTTPQLRRLYDARSRTYRATIERLEAKPRRLALARAHIGPRDRVLEVAVGPGAALVEMARSVDLDMPVIGLDLSDGMLRQAARRVGEAGLANVDLVQGDARALPFADGRFDVVFNAYMLDLIRLADMPNVLGEFHRVLRPGGRLVLLNLSKRDPSRLTWFERLYRALPPRWTPYVVGACRPVAMADGVHAAGFEGVTRSYVPNWLPAEIVTARRPSTMAIA